jgi:hypothetical protein
LGPFNGVLARKCIAKDQLIGRLFFTFVPESLFQLCTDAPSIAGCMESFDNHFIYIPRINLPKEFMENHPANFILTSDPGADFNCELVWGSGDFSSCIFVKAIREIQETEEIVLEKCGIRFNYVPSLRAASRRVCDEPMVELNSDLENEDLSTSTKPNNKDAQKKQSRKAQSRIEKISHRLAYLKEINWSVRPLGYHFGLDNNPINREALEELLGNTLYPEREEVVKFVKEKALLRIYMIYPSEKSYERSAPNGMCFVNAIYHAIQRNKDPVRFQDESLSENRPFPLCNDYITRYSKANSFQSMHEVFVPHSFEHMAISAIATNVKSNLKDLTDCKYEGYEWGKLIEFLFAMTIYPQEREPLLMFNLFDFEAEDDSSTLQLNSLHRSLIAKNPTAYTFDEAKFVLAEKNVVFYHASHFWVPYEDLPEVLSSAEDAMNLLVDDILRVADEIKK